MSDESLIQMREPRPHKCAVITVIFLAHTAMLIVAGLQLNACHGAPILLAPLGVFSLLQAWVGLG